MSTQSESTSNEETPSQCLYKALLRLPSICSECEGLCGDLEKENERTKERTLEANKFVESGRKIPERMLPLDRSAEIRCKLGELLEEGKCLCYEVSDAIDAGGAECVNDALNPGAAKWSIELQKKALEGAEEVFIELELGLISNGSVNNYDAARMVLLGGVYQNAFKDLGPVLMRARAKAKQQADCDAVQIEERNKNGYIIKPLDLAAYVLKTVILREKCPKDWQLNDRRLGIILKENRWSSIRQHKPPKQQNRLYVHVGDWDNFCQSRRFLIEAGKIKSDDWRVPDQDEMDSTKAKIHQEHLDAKQKSDR